ncbi:MAG: hypothetical protein EBT93_08910, partial [Alphaproteobacteria bacterium]|nr:hypothetical protein [Alphaproteobacteria bacterium]
ETEEREEDETEEEGITTERMLAPGFGRILEESIRNLENRLRHKNRPDEDEDITSEKSYMSESRFSFISEKKMSERNNSEEMSDNSEEMSDNSEEMSDNSEEMSDNKSVMSGENVNSEVGSDVGSEDNKSVMSDNMSNTSDNMSVMSYKSDEMSSSKSSTSRFSYRGGDIKTIKIENSRPTERVYNTINDLINDNNWNKNGSSCCFQFPPIAW